MVITKTDQLEAVRSETGVVSRAVSWKVPAAYVVCMLVWGTTWFAVRLCVQPGAYLACPAAAIRFTLAALLLGTWWMTVRRDLSCPDVGKMKWLALAGLLSGISYGLVYFAMHDASGGVAAVITAMAPLVTSFIAMLTGTEKPSRANIIGSIVAVAGIGLVFHDRLHVSTAQAGAVGLLLLCNLLSASSNVTLKHNGKNVAPLAMNVIFFISTATCLWLGAAFTNQLSVPWPPPVVPTMALLYLTLFGTLLAFGAFFYLLKTVRLSTAMTITFITPLVALTIDAFFEHQVKLTAQSYLGIAIVLVSVAASVLVQARKERQA